MTFDPRTDADMPQWLRSAILASGATLITTLAVSGWISANAPKADDGPPFLRSPGSPMLVAEHDTAPQRFTSSAVGQRDDKGHMPQLAVDTYVAANVIKPDTIDNPPATDAPEVLLLAALGYGEARGECKGGSDKCLAAVMHVALNRLSAGKWGDTLEDVVFAPKQFSALNQNDVNLRLIARMALTDGDKDWQRCKDVARRVLAGEIKDPTAGSLFYHEQSISPRWNRQMQRVARIGKHVFWKG